MVRSHELANARRTSVTRGDRYHHKMPPDVYFIIDRSARPQRTGRVLAESEGGLTIEWRDGSVEEVASLKSAMIKVRADSVAGSYAQSPDDFAARLKQDPLAIFLKVLRDSAARDSGRKNKAADIQQAVIPFGVNEQDARAAWKKVQHELRANPCVKTEGGSYKWVGELKQGAQSADSAAVDSDSVPRTESGLREGEARDGASQAPPSAGGDVLPPANKQLQTKAASDVVLTATATASAVRPTPAVTTPSDPADTQIQDAQPQLTPALDVPLLDALIQLASNPSKSEEVALRSAIDATAMPASGLERILAWALGLREGQAEVTGSELARLPEAALKIIAAKAADEKAAVLASVIDVRRDSKVATREIQSLDSEQKSLVLGSLLRIWRSELPNIDPAATKKYLDGLESSVRRIEASVDRLNLQNRVDLLGLSLDLRLSGGPGIAVARRLEPFLVGDRTSVEQLSDALLSSEIPAQRYLAAIGGEGLAMGGFRIACLSAIASGPDRALLDDPKTWTGLDMKSLEAIVGESPKLADPLLQGGASSLAALTTKLWINSTNDVSIVTTVLRWPRQLIELVPQTTFQQKLRLVRGARPEVDHLFSDQLEAQRVSELEKRAAGLVAEVAALAARADEAESRAGQLEEEIEAARVRIRSMQQAGGEAHASQLRQAQVDSIKTLCRVLNDVFVASATTGRGGNAVWERAMSTASAAGVSPIGYPNERVDFASELHEPDDFGLIMSEGQSAFVTHPGYIWIDGSNKLVITRALVALETTPD